MCAECRDIHVGEYGRGECHRHRDMGGKCLLDRCDANQRADKYENEESDDERHRRACLLAGVLGRDVEYEHTGLFGGGLRPPRRDRPAASRIAEEGDDQADCRQLRLRRHRERQVVAKQRQDENHFRLELPQGIRERPLKWFIAQAPRYQGAAKADDRR